MSDKPSVPRDVEADLAVIQQAWETLNEEDTYKDDHRFELENMPIAASLFAAVVGDGFEAGSIYPPAIGVLRSVRATIELWIERRDPVSDLELRLVQRRLDIADLLICSADKSSNKPAPNTKEGGES